MQQMHDVLQKAESVRARVVLAGDARQTSSFPKVGGAFRTLVKEARLAPLRMREVVRQREAEYAAAVESFSQDPSLGLHRLRAMGAVRQVKDEELISEAVKQYVAWSEQKAGKSPSVLVVTSKTETARAMTAQIRDALKARARLGPGSGLTRVRPLKWDEARKRSTSNYAPGMVLIFHKKTKAAGRHENVTITKVGWLTLKGKTTAGKRVSISKRQAKAFEVFARESIDVAAGDKLVLQAGRSLPKGRAPVAVVRDKLLGREFKAKSGEVVSVSEVKKDGSLRLEDGRTVPANYRHFDHAYALTAYSAQGRTADKVIVASPPMRREQFEVALSRARDEIAVLTTDWNGQRLAAEARETHRTAHSVQRAQLQAQTHEKSQSEGLSQRR